MDFLSYLYYDLEQIYLDRSYQIIVMNTSVTLLRIQSEASLFVKQAFVLLSSPAFSISFSALFVNELYIKAKFNASSNE